MFLCYVFYVSLEYVIFLLRVNLFKGYYVKFLKIDLVIWNVRNCIDKWDGLMEIVKKNLVIIKFKIFEVWWGLLLVLIVKWSVKVIESYMIRFFFGGENYLIFLRLII